MNSHPQTLDLRLRTELELSVIEDLRGLPANFVLNLQPERIMIAMGEERRRYNPGIEVVSPDGARLIVEVVSLDTLSIGNMARLFLIYQHVLNTGARFMLLVPNAKRGQQFHILPGEFEQLPLVFVDDRSQIVPAVLGGLNQPPSRT